MRAALLENGKIVTAKGYNEQIHGTRLYCIDCKAPVFYNRGSDKHDIVPHFKTSGKGESVHSSTCGFYRKLTFKETIEKISEYQKILQQNHLPEIVVKLNLNRIDPDYVPRSIERDIENNNKKERENVEVKIKQEHETPSTISSLRSIKKLFNDYDADVLASIVLNVNGRKVVISELIRHYKDAHWALWNGEINPKIPYFVHGVIDKIIRREKVWFINFENVDNCYFSLVVFEKYFKHFTYRDEDLLNKEILAVGYIRKNEFNKEIQATEMLIKSNKYIEFL